MRVLHFVKHVTESGDSLEIRFFKVGYPFIGPGEDSDAMLNTFFSGWLMAVEDTVEAPSGVCPANVGDNEGA